MATLRGIMPVALLLGFASLALASQQSQLDEREIPVIASRGENSYKIWNRERNAHACIMSIVFIVLYPLGAISIHLPIEKIPFLRNTYLTNRVMAIHAPIQIIGFVMMIGGMALGIKIAQYVDFLKHPVRAHVVIGFIVVCTLILFQPILGILQHLHYKKTGGKSKFAYVHRWLGRGCVLLGMINSGLGFHLAKKNAIVPKHSYVRSYVLIALLVTIWVCFVAYDELRLRKVLVDRREEEKTRT